MTLFSAAILLGLATAATAGPEKWKLPFPEANPNRCSEASGCTLETSLECVVTDGEDRLIEMDCINPTIAGEVNPFFAGEDTAGGPCPYEPSTVEITYEICNGDNQYDLFLDQEKTQLMYDSTDITPTSIFASPIAPNECVFHVHEVTWDMCDVPDVVKGSGDIGESVFPYSIIAEGYLKRDDPFVDETGKQVDAGGKAGDPFPDSENKYCSCYTFRRSSYVYKFIKGDPFDRTPTPSTTPTTDGAPTQPTVPEDSFDCIDDNWEVAISDTMIISCSDIGYGKLCELSNASGDQGSDCCSVCENEPVPCPPSAPTPDSIESPTPSPTSGDLDNITKEPLVDGLIVGSISSSAADTKKYGATFVAFILAALALV